MPTPATDTSAPPPPASTAFALLLDPLPVGESLRTSSLLLKCIDCIGDTMLITDALPVDGTGPRVVYVNHAFERMTGYAAADIVGRTPRILQGPRTDRRELDRIKAALVAWLPVRAELVNYKKNGDAFMVEMDIVPIGDDHGRWTHWVSIMRDVTARKKAESEALARDAQRYESLGTLSSGIAHDFNNIIAAILGNAAIGALDMQAGQLPFASMEQIKTAALRARSVVAKILTYAQRRSASTVPLRLAPVVFEATDLLRAIVPAGVRLEVRCPTEALWVHGDTTQLCQVLMNLGVNALQSLQGKCGRIDVTLKVTGTASGLAPTPGGPSATIEVADTGCGMDAVTRARIFEPYFTTKPDGHGTGLGLSVVYGIVAAHQGTISVHSKVGQGSRFTVSLPLIEDVVAEPMPLIEPVSVGTIGRGEHVLVVDDDEVIVAMLEGMLTRWGFRVTTLQDPLQALELVEGAPDDFDAVVTDLHMPNISGLQLAQELRCIRADMPVLLGSGTVTDDLLEAARKVGISAVFPKEYAVEQLGTLMKEMVARLPKATAAADRATPVAAFGGDANLDMRGFLHNNRGDLVARCKAKVALRPSRQATESQLANGVPRFLDELIRTLSAEDAGEAAKGLAISGRAGGDPMVASEIGVGASAHGKELLDLGYSLDEVVHDYGDLCQAITDLAVERNAPFSVGAFRTLNRCLDNAIASAVAAFATARDAALVAGQAAEENRRVGVLAHELRNHLHVAEMAFSALESGKLSIAGATGVVLKRNLGQLNKLISETLCDVSEASRPAAAHEVFSLAGFIAEAATIARFYAEGTSRELHTQVVDPALAVQGDRELLLAALTNLLHNAFKFTRPKTEVVLTANAVGDRLLIEVGDQCGGLPPRFADKMFTPFTQAKVDRRGVGLGLSIAAQSVVASGGVLSVKDHPGHGCVFTIDLPRFTQAPG